MLRFPVSEISEEFRQDLLTVPEITPGIREQLIFPEIDFDQIDQIRGMNITIVTSTDSDQESRDLLEGMGFPFRN